MKKENRGGVPLAGLTVAAILLASTAGYVSALSRMFQAPMISEESGNDFLSEADTSAPAAKIPAASFEQSLGRMAAAWLVNALPGYSSGHARELWYLSLDSAGDRQLRFENSGSYNSYSPVRSDLFSFNQPSAVAPLSGSVSASSFSAAPTAPANTGSTISWSGLGSNNSWTTAANWTGGVAPANDLTTDLALFNLTTYPRQPTANSVSIAGIRVGDGSTATAALTISGSGTGLAIGADGIIIFANAGATTITAVTTIGAAQSWTNNSSNLFSITTGGVTYSNLLTLNGGTFRFNAAGTGAGGVKITSGSSVTNGSTGAIFGTGVLELNSGTYLNSTASSVRSLANTVSITGNFTFDSGGGINEFTGLTSTTGDRTITVNNATTRFTNTFTLGGNLTTAGNGRLNLQGGLNLGGADRTITAGATGANPGNFISGAIDSTAAGNKLILAGNNFSIGSGATGVTPGANIVNFDVNATGTISFAGPNTFLGSVTVEAGTVNVTNDSGLGSSTAATAGLFMTPSSGTATVNFTSLTPAIASLSSSGAGTSNVVLGNTSGTPSATTLTVGGNNAAITTFAGSISDKTGTNAAAIGSLTKTGSGILVLSGANTYTGATTIAAGELFLASSGSLLPTSTIRLGDTAANSASAMFTFGSSSGGVTLANPMTVQASASGTEGTRTLLGLAEGGNTNTYSGVVTMNTGLTVQSAATGGSVTNGQGILLFQGGSINVGTSTLTVNSNLRGNNADTYSIQGIVTINELLSSGSASGGSIFKDGSGTLILQGTSNTYTGTSAGALNANGTRIGGGVLAIYGDGSLGLAPSTATNNVFFVAPGTSTNVDSIAPTLRADAGGITLSATRNINIASGVTGRIDSNGNTFTVAGVINGPGNLAKTGAGTLILSGNNTYTGTTTVSAGTLLVNGNQSAATGAMTVNNSGTTLGGNGVIGASLTTVNSGANLAPGSSTGILTTGSVTLNSGSNFVLELNNTTPGTGYDQLVVNGSVTLNTGNIVVIAGGGLNVGDKFFVVVNDGVDPVVGAFAQGATVTSGSDTFLINYLDDSNGGLAGNDISLTLQPIPEPSTWIGAALALGTIAFTQRRRVRSYPPRRIRPSANWLSPRS